jgi:hypothetical protein
MALTGSAAMMALALVLVLALIVRQRRPVSAIAPVAEASVDVA